MVCGVFMQTLTWSLSQNSRHKKAPHDLSIGGAVHQAMVMATHLPARILVTLPAAISSSTALEVRASLHRNRVASSRLDIPS
jgi:hypothetical protein